MIKAERYRVQAERCARIHPGAPCSAIFRRLEVEARKKVRENR